MVQAFETFFSMLSELIAYSVDRQKKELKKICSGKTKKHNSAKVKNILKLVYTRGVKK